MIGNFLFSWSALLLILWGFFQICGLLSAWHAISFARTSQAAVAWVVGLLILPIFVLPLYWVFGRDKFAGYQEAIRLAEKEYRESVEAARRELLTDMNVGAPSSRSPLGHLADILDTQLSCGNHFRLLVDGVQFFEELLEQINSAERYIYAQFYIIRNDDIGKQFAEALCNQARAGRTVRLLYDEFGCLKLPKSYIRKLRDAGVNVHAFNTRQGWTNRFQVNFRNHRKLLLVDGQRAIVGGLNVGDEYLGRVAWTTKWRDTAISVDGAVARKLQAAFAADYHWATRSDLPEAFWSRDLNHHDLIKRNPDSEDAAGLAAVCATGPADRRDQATMMFAATAGSSKYRLWISSPYLVPDETCINALSMARARGVDVRILVPLHPDQWLVHLAGFYYEKLFELIGIPVFRYQDGFLHQKCVLVDDQLVLIGSTNLDNRSLHLNFELMLGCSEPKLVQDVAEMMEEDFASAKNMRDGEARLPPWYIRMGTVVARLFSPIL